MIRSWIEGVGLTVPQFIGFLLTIAASFLAARFGASESRRQHREKMRLDTLTAAGELLQSLYKFANRLEAIFYDISNERGSKGHAGRDHSSLSDAALPDNVFQLAARLGGTNLAELIKLDGARHLAEQNISSSFEYVDHGEAVSQTQAWSAQLIIMTFDLMNQIAKSGRVPLNFQSAIDNNELRKTASDRIDDLSLGQLPQRVGRAAALKSTP